MKVLFPSKAFKLRKENGVCIVEANNGTEPNTDKEKYDIALLFKSFLMGVHKVEFWVIVCTVIFQLPKFILSAF